MRLNPRFAGAPNGAEADAEGERDARETVAHWERHDFGWWMMNTSKGGGFVGCGGRRSIELGSHHEVERGFGLDPGYWGRGLATAFARVAVAQAIVRPGSASLVGFARPGTAAARRGIEKARFPWEREVVHAGLLHVIDRLSAQGWSGAAPELRSCTLAATPKRAVAM